MKITGISLAFIMFFLSVSCSSSEESTAVEIFGGEFTGALTYFDSTTELIIPEGSVQVTQQGDYWNFDFPGEIPTIDSIRFLTSADGEVMMNENAEETRLIRITARTLQIVYNEDGQFWHAECFRP